jgi:hypothetical protein
LLARCASTKPSLTLPFIHATSLAPCRHVPAGSGAWTGCCGCCHPARHCRPAADSPAARPGGTGAVLTEWGRRQGGAPCQPPAKLRAARAGTPPNRGGGVARAWPVCGRSPPAPARDEAPRAAGAESHGPPGGLPACLLACWLAGLLACCLVRWMLLGAGQRLLCCMECCGAGVLHGSPFHSTALFVGEVHRQRQRQDTDHHLTLRSCREARH